MLYINVFSTPLLKQIYNTAESSVDNMDQLIQKFTRPDNYEALVNLKRMVEKPISKYKTFLDFSRKWPT